MHRWLVQNRPEDSLAQDAIYDPLASPSAELEQRREFAYFPTGIRMPTYIWAPKDRSGRQWNLYRWRNGYSTSIETELCRVASSDRPLIAQVPELRLRVITDQEITGFRSTEVATETQVLPVGLVVENTSTVLPLPDIERLGNPDDGADAP